MRALAIAVWFLVLSSTAFGASLKLDGDQFWVGLASGQTEDEAIGLAGNFGIKPLTVVGSANGWFAAISGPYHVAPGGGRAFLDKLRKEKGAPADAYLTRGASYTDVVWRPPPDHVEATFEYDGEHEAEMVRGDLRLKISRQADGKDAFDPVLTAEYKGKRAFRIAIGDNPNEKPAAKVRLVRLDPSSPLPAIVFTYYWQGAHCCTLTKVASLQPDGSWSIVSAGALNGDGYGFEDLDGKGRSFLVTIDQSFLYTFASYAGSFAPPKIEQLEGGKLIDVTRDPPLRRFIVQERYRQKANAKQQDELKTHGYLAAFVADSLMLGEGEEAWRAMLASYDRGDAEADFGIDKCSIDLPLSKCPDDKKVKMPFPEGLRQFLTEHGYMSDPNRFEVPLDTPQRTAMPVNPLPSSDMPPQLQRCSQVSDTVQKLIYQQFAGRKIGPGESVTDVSLQNDETLEGYDQNIGKATCAVSYSFAPRNLIGRLAEDGNIARAASLGRLSRGRGGTVTGRVRYTVKPTATAGSSFIELLP